MKKQSPPSVETVCFYGMVFQVLRRRVKYSRVEYSSRNPRIIIPPWVDLQKFLDDWGPRVRAGIRRVRREGKASRELPVWERSPEELEELVEMLTRWHLKCLGLEGKPPVVRFRKMKRRWGTCYSDGRIFLNKYISCLPRELVSFVVFHELTHLRIISHDRRFRKTMERRFPDYRSLQSRLKLYGIRLLR